MAYQFPTEDVYLIEREIAADWRKGPMQPLADDIDQRIAAALNVPLAPFTTSIEAAFDLRDIVLAEIGYVNVDFREYCLNGVMSYICDLKTENSEACGHGMTRARALTAAVLSHVQYEIEGERDRQRYS